MSRNSRIDQLDAELDRRYAEEYQHRVHNRQPVTDINVTPTNAPALRDHAAMVQGLVDSGEYLQANSSNATSSSTSTPAPQPFRPGSVHGESAEEFDSYSHQFRADDDGDESWTA